MPKKTKRKTGDTFIFTTSKAMGKRIREHCAKTGQPIGPWIRSVVAREISPNLPRQSWSRNDQWKDEIYKTMAEDVTPEREFVTIQCGQSAGKTTAGLAKIRKVLEDARSGDGRLRVNDVDETGLVIQSEFISPDKMTPFQ